MTDDKYREFIAAAKVAAEDYLVRQTIKSIEKQGDKADPVWSVRLQSTFNGDKNETDRLYF